jgi:hypothetical protein
MKQNQIFLKFYRNFTTPFILSLIMLFAITVKGQDHSTSGDCQYHKHLSVGSFLETGRSLGFAGGIRYSDVTLSIQALPGEAPFMVKDATGLSGLTIRPNGDVYIDKNLVVYGQKQFVQPHPNDPEKIISYIALEGPEAGTYIRGTAEIVNGEAVIELPEHFSFTTCEEGLTVLLTPVDCWLQLYVTEKSTQKIVIKEASDKSGNFDYIVQGVRLGHEGHQVISTK